jgi:hypothetical protein
MGALASKNENQRKERYVEADPGEDSNKSRRNLLPNGKNVSRLGGWQVPFFRKHDDTVVYIHLLFSHT